MKNLGVAIAAAAALWGSNASASITTVAEGVIDETAIFGGIDILVTSIPNGYYVFSTEGMIDSGWIYAAPRYHVHAHTDRGTSLYGTTHFNEGPWPAGAEPTYVFGLHTVQWYMEAPPESYTHSDECWYPGDCGVNESIETELAILGASLRMNPGSEGLRWKLTVSDTQLPLPPGVPEPSTWAMLLIGFGGLGAVLRARRNQAPAIA